MNWTDKKKPGPPKKSKKRQTIRPTVHYNVYVYLKKHQEVNGVGSSGRLIDKLFNERCGVNIDA